MHGGVGDRWWVRGGGGVGSGTGGSTNAVRAASKTACRVLDVECSLRRVTPPSQTASVKGANGGIYSKGRMGRLYTYRWGGCVVGAASKTGVSRLQQVAVLDRTGFHTRDPT